MHIDGLSRVVRLNTCVKDGFIPSVLSRLRGRLQRTRRNEVEPSKRVREVRIKGAGCEDFFNSLPAIDFYAWRSGSCGLNCNWLLLNKRPCGFFRSAVILRLPRFIAKK
jgi:hypothetical protein